jgi:FtsH-binding integral membrane protein
MSYNYPDAHLHTFIDTGFSGTLGSVLQRVYLWMTLRLFTTAGVAALVNTSPFFQVLAGRPLIFFGLLIGELALVMELSWGIKRISTGTALILFFAFAALNGLTLAVLFLVYTLGSVAHVFWASAVLFGVMSLIGYTTKINLAKVGTFLFMGLVGLLIAMFVNILWANSTLAWIITFVGIFLFLGLTMFDTQRIKRMTATALRRGHENIEARLGIVGALSLYLDFINLFLFLLRLRGQRR